MRLERRLINSPACIAHRRTRLSPFMDTKQPPPPAVAVPRLGGDIIIRQFQSRDAAQVHALLVEGLVWGPESPRNAALRRNFTRPLSCLTYLGVLLGLGCCALQKKTALRVGGALLALGSATFFAHVRRMTTRMFVTVCATARETDMQDIARTYEIPREAGGVQGPGGFWVAAIDSPDGETSEVVGYLGLGFLDYHVNADPTSGELRRMIVSMNHRRRRIGSLLITAAMDHARRHAPPLTTIDLETSEFQPGAQKLYRNMGFRLVGDRRLRMGRFFSVQIVRLRTELEANR
ncbi:acyl-CoA N-acyltransferase [Mycena filopes]|nr:acyl-CoA N-acyltransferase [Mycena filopes]